MHLAYQSAYNKSVAGKARSLNYRQSARGKLTALLRKQRRTYIKAGQTVPDHLYMTNALTQAIVGVP